MIALSIVFNPHSFSDIVSVSLPAELDSHKKISLSRMY